MNYGDVYPSQQAVPLQQMPPQVLISDHSTGVPYTIGFQTPGAPYIPLLPTAVGTTTIPCTTPASVLPPSPPAALTTQLPHVFISDHSEAPALMDLRNFPNLDVNVNFPSVSDSSDAKAVSPLVRRASEPAETLSSSLAQQRPGESVTVSKKKSRPPLQRYQSTTRTPTHWVKCFVVVLICILVFGLTFKICIELWQASYGEEVPPTSVVQQL